MSFRHKGSTHSTPTLSEEENASGADYANTGYPRGHAVPCDDMSRKKSVPRT